MLICNNIHGRVFRWRGWSDIPIKQPNTSVSEKGVAAEWTTFSAFDVVANSNNEKVDQGGLCLHLQNLPSRIAQSPYSYCE